MHASMLEMFASVSCFAVTQSVDVEIQSMVYARASNSIEYTDNCGTSDRVDDRSEEKVSLLPISV